MQAAAPVPPGPIPPGPPASSAPPKSRNTAQEWFSRDLLVEVGAALELWNTSAGGESSVDALVAYVRKSVPNFDAGLRDIGADFAPAVAIVVIAMNEAGNPLIETIVAATWRALQIEQYQTDRNVTLPPSVQADFGLYWANIDAVARIVVSARGSQYLKRLSAVESSQQAMVDAIAEGLQQADEGLRGAGVTVDPAPMVPLMKSLSARRAQVKAFMEAAASVRVAGGKPDGLASLSRAAKAAPAAPEPAAAAPAAKATRGGLGGAFSGLKSAFSKPKDKDKAATAAAAAATTAAAVDDSSPDAVPADPSSADADMEAASTAAPQARTGLGISFAGLRSAAASAASAVSGAVNRSLASGKPADESDDGTGATPGEGSRGGLTGLSFAGLRSAAASAASAVSGAVKSSLAAVKGAGVEQAPLEMSTGPVPSFFIAPFLATGTPDEGSPVPALLDWVREHDEVTDVIIWSHGWNMRPDQVLQLYAAWYAQHMAILDQRRADAEATGAAPVVDPLLIGIFWPSKREEEAWSTSTFVDTTRFTWTSSTSPEPRSGPAEPVPAVVPEVRSGALTDSIAMAKQLPYIRGIKRRAANVGIAGVAPMLHDFLNIRRNLNVHLVGHSLGSTVLLTALMQQTALPPTARGRASSLLLMQPAISEWSFAATMPAGFDLDHSAGAFNTPAGLVERPVVVTCSRSDRFLRFYPNGFSRRDDVGDWAYRRDFDDATAVGPSGKPEDGEAETQGDGTTPDVQATLDAVDNDADGAQQVSAAIKAHLAMGADGPVASTPALAAMSIRNCGTDEATGMMTDASRWQDYRYVAVRGDWGHDAFKRLGDGGSGWLEDASFKAEILRLSTFLVHAPNSALLGPSSS